MLWHDSDVTQIKSENNFPLGQKKIDKSHPEISYGKSSVPIDEVEQIFSRNLFSQNRFLCFSNFLVFCTYTRNKKKRLNHLKIIELHRRRMKGAVETLWAVSSTFISRKRRNVSHKFSFLFCVVTQCCHERKKKKT